MVLFILLLALMDIHVYLALRLIPPLWSITRTDLMTTSCRAVRFTMSDHPIPCPLLGLSLSVTSSNVHRSRVCFLGVLMAVGLVVLLLDVEGLQVFPMALWLCSDQGTTLGLYHLVGCGPPVRLSVRRPVYGLFPTRTWLQRWQMLNVFIMIMIRSLTSKGSLHISPCWLCVWAVFDLFRVILI